MQNLSTETARKPEQLSRDQQTIVDYLKQHGPTAIHTLGVKTGLGWTRTAYLVESLRTNNWRVVNCGEKGICSFNGKWKGGGR